MIIVPLKALYFSLAFLAVALAFAVLWGAAEFSRTNRQLRAMLNEAQWAVADVRPDIKTIASQGKLLSFEARTALKEFSSDFNSTQNMRGRMASMRAGESVAALAEAMRADTLPRLNADLDRIGEAIVTSNALLANADASINGQLIPEAAKLLTSLRGTSDAFNVDGRALLAEILVITKQGGVTLEAVNRVVSSPEWEQTLKNVARGTGNIADATAELPKTAASIEKILATAERWQKPMLLASILATIANALIP